ncbi:uncharacterized protein isoform X2 [Musca autumnalis]|uniref:uncharacterized protein isoform X2 n=1 Tax=Musca autumnalis TaxID=221902 RepID=UPI003CF6FE44
MSESFCIKTEPIAKDCEPEDCNNNTNTLSYTTTKLENFTNMLNDIKEDRLDLEEFLPEKIDKVAFDVIKEEDVDKMEEFLPKDSPSIYSPSSLTWKSDDCTKAIIHDEAPHERGTQHYLTNITTEQISLPKLEIIDVHEDEPDSKGIKVTDDEHSKINNKKEGSRHVRKCKNYDKTCENNNTKKSEHKCEICGNCYRGSHTLREHIRNKHPLSINTEHICKICHQKFTTEIGLATHSYRRHPVATEHKCEICGSYHIRPKALQMHMRNKHPEIRFTQTRKHKCELCDCSYTDDSSLRVHLRNKHPSSINTEHICKICHKKFTTERGLAKHVKMHPEIRSDSQTKYKCPKCGRIMKTKSGLINHFKNHGHHCPACGKCYKELFDLTIHIKWSHPKEKEELQKKISDSELSPSVVDDIIEQAHFD